MCTEYIQKDTQETRRLGGGRQRAGKRYPLFIGSLCQAWFKALGIDQWMKQAQYIPLCAVWHILCIYSPSKKILINREEENHSHIMNSIYLFKRIPRYIVVWKRVTIYIIFFVHKQVYIYKIPYVYVCRDECKYMRKNLEGLW